MNCCNPTIVTFAAALTTTVPFTGTKPTVSVAYLQSNGTFLIAGVFTQINIIGFNVVVDHGGLASGVIKLLQE